MIKYHHTPYAQDTRFNDYIKVIHVADIVAYKSRVSGGIDRDSYCLNNDVIHDLHMEKELINKMVENVRPSLKEFDRVLIN